MGSRVHPVLVALVVLVVVVVVALVYARRTEMPKPVLAPGGGEVEQMQGQRRGGGGGGRGGSMGGGRAGAGGRAGGGMTDPTLKITFGPSQSPMGFRIDKMESTSPLKVMGLKEGDVVTSANGQRAQIKQALAAGIQALQTNGTPLELTIDRGGKTQTIKWAQKLPTGALNAAPQEPAARGGKRGG
ncbi:MAG: hypothetical protein ABSD48_01520 [Armatimonadota bacterium]|jgi:hypothetical protein